MQVNPLDDEEMLLVQTVWDLVPARMHWPDYDTLDRLLYREHGKRTSTQSLRASQPTCCAEDGHRAVRGRWVVVSSC